MLEPGISSGCDDYILFMMFEDFPKIDPIFPRIFGHPNLPYRPNIPHIKSHTFDVLHFSQAVDGWYNLLVSNGGTC